MYEVKSVSYDETKPFILEIHYAKRMPSISYSFGLFRNDELVGVVTYGKPATPSICKGIAGKDNKEKVFELNRLVLKDNLKNEASILISKSLKLLPPNLIIVSYSDTNEDHIGYVYQATNFLYTGITRFRTDIYSLGHPRHYDKNSNERITRSQKHRYVIFTGSKTNKKHLRNKLRYRVYDEYPKQLYTENFVETLK